MCSICDGKSFEEVTEEAAERIDEYGFTMQGVEPHDGPTPSPGWIYTIGLVPNARHPEFIVVGGKVEVVASLVSQLAHDVLDGERFAVGDTIGFDGSADVFRVGAVHPWHYEHDTFNSWHNLREYGAFEADALEAVQIVLPRSWFCEAHQNPDLSLPQSRIVRPASTPNRAARRAYERRRHR